MVSPEIILEARNLSVIYGSPKREAVRMMEEGSDKAGVYSKTGATVALWEVNFQVKRGELSSSSASPAPGSRRLCAASISFSVRPRATSSSMEER